MKRKLRNKQLRKIADRFGLTMDGVEFALEQYQEVICNITNWRMSKLCYYARDILAVAEDIQQDFCLACENEKEKERWISVKDRLPEEKENPLRLDFQEVICFCDFGGVPKRTDVRTYGFGKRHWENEPHFWHGPTMMDGVVTHWMPMPEPPKGDEECASKT